MTEADRLIDAEKFYGRFDNDPALIRQVLEIFQAEVPDRLARIEAAASAGDVAGMIKIAHSLKGVCATMYAEPLRAKALETEMAARSGDETALWRLALEMTAMLKELARFLETLGQG